MTARSLKPARPSCRRSAPRSTAATAPGTVELTLRDSYYNMKEKIEPCLFLIENAKRAMEQLGIEPKVVPIRGGTDGARLSFEGLPCPNLCTGGENFHGRFEYIPAEDMERITQLLAVMLWNLAE